MSFYTHNTLPVIAVISNPARYQSRYRLYKEFEARMKSNPAIRLITVEAAFGDRVHEVTEGGHPDHLLLKITHELWHKENMINLGVRHLARTMPDWPWFAAVDADVTFVRPDWAEETMHQLQHFDVVQMWENAIDLGPPHLQNIIQPHHTSFGKIYNVGKLPSFVQEAGYNKYAHTGYAWAYRRRWYENVGKLLDFAIVGAADHHMAWGMIGDMKKTIPRNLHKSAPEYTRAVEEWGQRATRATNHNLGYVPGTILHHWHGKKKARNYWNRWEVVERNRFDPHRHLMYDANGVLILAPDSPHRLRDDLRNYFRARNEDSIDLE